MGGNKGNICNSFNNKLKKNLNMPIATQHSSKLLSGIPCPVTFLVLAADFSIIPHRMIWSTKKLYVDIKV